MQLKNKAAFLQESQVAVSLVEATKCPKSQLKKVRVVLVEKSPLALLSAFQNAVVLFFKMAHLLNFRLLKRFLKKTFSFLLFLSLAKNVKKFLNVL